MTHDRPKLQRGFTLLECAAALALGALVVDATVQASGAAAGLMRSATQESQTLDVVRNLVEHELGAACAAAMSCPDGFRCSLTRSAVTVSADRIVVRASRADSSDAEEIHVLAPPRSCGG
ncbi:MAG TPA: prepilin-type N-terminal cleavage/methylation domain-containing protein [Candidatus Binatia bacterium]